MAIVNGKSGKFNISTQNQYISGYVEWQETYDDSTYISTNKSTVTIRAYLHRTNIYSGATYLTNIAGQRIAYFGSETVVDNSNLTLSIAGNSSSSGGPYTKVFEAKKEITHDSNGGKSLTLGFYMTNVESGSGANAFKVAKTTSNATLMTIPRYATSNQSLKSGTETTITMNWSSDSTIDYVWYSTDWGTTWKAVGSVNAKSGSYTITKPSNSDNNLSANTTYNIITRVRRKDSQLTTNSSKLSVTTFDYPHCTKAPNFTIGDSVTLEFYNPLNRTFTMSVLGNDNSTILEVSMSGTSRASLGGETSVANLYKSITNSKSGTYKVKVVYGTIEKTKTGGTYSIKGTETPTIGTITYADTNTTVTAITGNNQHIVQNQSNLKVSFTSATAKNSATISKHTFTLNGVTKTSTSASGTVDFGKINSANNLTLTVTVTDSRGLTASATKTITILAHNDPSAIVTLERLNNYEDETYLTVDGSISSVNSKNTMTIQYRYKVSGGSYGDYTTISDNEKQTLTLDKNNAYIFNVIITDAFGSTYNKEHVLGKGVFPLFIDTEKNSVGINCFPNNEKSLEVDGNVEATNLPKAIGINSVESFDDVETNGTLFKSGLYSVCVDETWYHLLNIRHRNGVTDGTKYGLQIRKRFTVGQPLEYRQQNNGEWSEWVKISDYANGASGSNAITVGLSENKELTSTTAYQNLTIPFNKVNSVTGNLLTLDGNGNVVIGKGISKILVSAKMGCPAFTDNTGLRIYKSGTSLSETWSDPTTALSSVTSDVVLADVSEGDKIYASVYINTSGTKRTLRNGVQTTLTVIVIG